MRARFFSRLAPVVLYLVFAASGAAGLIYESIWSRYLGLFVGHTAYAQVIVLSIFLGGMSAGSLAVGRRSDRMRRPLLWYAAAELAVGLGGLVFHNAFVWITDSARDTLFPALGDSPSLTVVRWSIAALLILPQSLLLGTTFPLMSAAIVRHQPARAGGTVAMLYFANSIGAAIGVLVAGFHLVGAFGLPGAILTAAALNLGAAIIAYLATYVLTGERAAAPPVAPCQQTSAPANFAKLALAVAFGTAVASFIYEIAWIRMLSLLLGSATHSFELMLSAFIFGLALGALWIRRFVDRQELPLRALAWAQWIMGAAALVSLTIYIRSFDWMAVLMQTFDRTSSGYAGFTVARYALCLAMMFPATFCAGMTLPLLTKTLMSSGWGERAIGWIYGVNTLGSIVGVVLASLVLLPLIGLKFLLILGATIDMVLGVATFARAASTSTQARRLATGFAVVTAALLALTATFAQLDRTVLASGVFRSGQIPHPGDLELSFYRDGRTATISVMRNQERGDLTLATNGKPDASLSPEWFAPPDPEKRDALLADNATQVLVSLIALAYKPDARNAAIIGLGSGASTHFLLSSPRLQDVVTVEIEPAVVEAARTFYPANRRAFDDRRGRIVNDDAKAFFAAAPAPFDLIVSEPSNPWVSGVADLFTWEFYETVAQHLSPNGIFAQWLHLYEIDDDLVLTILAALHMHFASYEMFQVAPGDVVIIASKEHSLPAPDWSVFQQPAVLEDMRRFVPFTPATLNAMRVINRAALAPLFDLGVVANSDFFPLLDLGAEEARFLKRGAKGFRAIATDRFDLAAPFIGRRPLAGEPHDTITEDARLEARARSARLRAARDAGTLGSLSGGADSDAAHRLSVWQRLLASNAPPADWRHWIADTLVVEADLHGGSAGYEDKVFYDQARDYLERFDAPSAARDALAYIEALATWDFAAVSASADRLLPYTVAGDPWVPPDLLLTGAVIAKLELRQQTAARSLFEALASTAYRDPNDLRRRLLDAYVTTPKSVVFPPS